MAIKISIFSLDFDSIMNILAFSRSYKVILCLESADLDMLILTNSFDIIREMVEASMQFERVVKPKKSGRKGIPVGLEPWVGGWQPSPESALLYPPPGMRAAKGLPGILAGNPGAPETLPRLFIAPRYRGGPGSSYMHLPLAHRLDIDKLFGLMKMCPEWDSISCHGSHGDEYKQYTWEHMS